MKAEIHNGNEELESRIAELEKNDYIVESGENYRKWNSGILECWGTKKLYNTAIDKESSTEYINSGDRYSFGDYPIPFKEGTIPNCVIQLEQNFTLNITIKLRIYGAGSTTTPPEFFLVSPNSLKAASGYGYIVHYQAIRKMEIKRKGVKNMNNKVSKHYGCRERERERERATFLKNKQKRGVVNDTSDT